MKLNRQTNVEFGQKETVRQWWAGGVFYVRMHDSRPFKLTRGILGKHSNKYEMLIAEFRPPATEGVWAATEETVCLVYCPKVPDGMRHCMAGQAKGRGKGTAWMGPMGAHCAHGAPVPKAPSNLRPPSYPQWQQQYPNSFDRGSWDHFQM